MPSEAGVQAVLFIGALTMHHHRLLWAMLIGVFLLAPTVAMAGGDLRLGGSLVGRIENDGSIRVGGSVVGKFESNGDIRIKGTVVGKIESNGDIRKKGSIVGSVESNGDVRVGGSVKGRIESNGSVRKGGSVIGSARGVKPERAAAIFFFEFIEL